MKRLANAATRVGICFVIILCFSLTACEKGTKDSQVSYQYGLISSYEQDATSKVLYLDKQANIVGKKKLKISNIGAGSYGYPIIKDGYVYERSQGQGFDKKNCAIISMNLSNGEVKKYKFPGLVGISAFAVTDTYIYVVTNLNYKTYLERYCFENDTIEKYVIEDVIATDMCVCQEKVYLFDEVSGDGKSYKVYCADITSQSTRLVADISSYYNEGDGFGFQVGYGKNIYFTHNDEILKLNVETGKVKSIPLDCKEAFGAYIADGKLYVSSCDIFDIDSPADILIVDLSTDTVTQSYHLETSVMQFYVSKDHLSVLGSDNTLYIYEITNEGECKLQYKNNLEEKGYDFIMSFYEKP
ncbi:MAG: hypothetical protein IIY81_08040 [Lachnospiraceae bacterium]|nr:hypothetical protein [Lachnospiraceae bacterium]